MTEALAASAAVGLSTAELVLGPEEEGAGGAAGVEAAAGSFLSRPCWLIVLDMDDWRGQRNRCKVLIFIQEMIKRHSM